MNYELLKDMMDLVHEFEEVNTVRSLYSNNIQGFKQWISDTQLSPRGAVAEPHWEGKENGRSAESDISTSLVHLNRYAKTYSRSAIYGSEFSTQEEFIYLINLKAFGEMTKMELIKKNIHDKPVGTQIINRLIAHGWVEQRDSLTDRRSKLIKITAKGLKVLEQQMDKIRQATMVVAGDLDHDEKMELIRLLNKLKNFHHSIYCRNLEPASLLTEAIKTKTHATA